MIIRGNAVSIIIRPLFKFSNNGSLFGEQRLSRNLDSWINRAIVVVIADGVPWKTRLYCFKETLKHTY